MALSLDEALGMSLADEVDESIHVNVNTRQITIPESQQLFGVESDADVEVKHIIIDGRYANGNRDLSKLAWRVIYRNANKETSYYLIPSVVANENSIEMDWLIKRSVVAYKGTVDFILCAFATTSSGEVTPEWNSTLGQGIVLEGLETSAIDIGKESVDELSKILYETITARDAAANSAADADNTANSIKDSMTQIAANKKAVSQLKEELDTVKQRVANITPDDSIVGGKPWSSKHIIDMLCPPLEESGNPVECYPVAGYPLGVKASWEPTQEGTGTPNPENISPIKGRDSVTVERCGENILNPKAYKSTTTNGITFTVNDDKSVHITGTSTGRAVFKLYSCTYKMSLPDGKYTISTIANIPSGVRVLIGHYNKNSLLYENNLVNIVSGNSFATAFFRKVEWLDGFIDVSSGNTVDITLYPMLVPGSTPPTTYTPYTGQTNTLTLPETVYGGEVDAVSGEGIKNWERLVFDGTEAWKYDTRGFFIYSLPQKAKSAAELLCDRYTGKYVSTAEALYVENKIFVVGTSVCGHTTVSEWNAYLAAQYAAGTPVQVCYKLASPDPFTATGAQPIPALSGTNTVLTDADSVTVTGGADPIKRITDLETSIASMT